MTAPTSPSPDALLQRAASLLRDVACCASCYDKYRHAANVLAEEIETHASAPTGQAGWQLLPIVPTVEMLRTIRNSKWPDDWEVGKAMQLKHGLDVVPPETNIECAAGQYVRLLAVAPKPESP